jgi:serine/threonine protein kinase
LKPENILLTFDEDQEKCVNLKLCDFGLSATFVPNQPLTEFCGSPGKPILITMLFYSFSFSFGFFCVGFFAAEMLIHGKYFGDKVDVWSIGCILMELILGPNKFHEIWMINYSPDIVMEKDKFSEGIIETLNELNEFLYSFSPEVRDLISKLLSFHATNRPVISALVNHPWCSEYLQDAMTELVQVKRQMSGQFNNSNHLLDTPTLVQHAERPWSPSPAPLTISLSFDGSNIRPGSAGNRNNSNSSAQNSPMVMLRQPSNPQQAAPQDIIKSAYDNLSDKERKQIEEYILQQRQQNESPENMIKLPPITPATPSISHARKILRRGEELANRSVSEQQAPNHHNMHSHNHNQPQDNGQQHPKGILTSSSYDLLQPTYSNSEIPLSPMGGISQNSFHTPLSHKNRSPLPSVSELNFGIDDGIDSMNNTMNESKHK